MCVQCGTFPMQFLGHPYTKKVFVVYLNFSYRESCILFANLKPVVERSLPNSVIKDFSHVLLGVLLEK